MSAPSLTPVLASRLAGAALGHVAREYPGVLVHVLAEPRDLRAPRDLHPVFFGSFDWHSCVHAHWLLARVMGIHPDLAEAEAIRQHVERSFTAEKIAGECAYFARPQAAGFERPYGWAWLLKLSIELHRHPDADARAWGERLRPLTRIIVARFMTFLPEADYPVRAGVHSNTAFALLFALEYAAAFNDAALHTLVGAKARAWYGADADCQAWEPSGDDFLSPALIEAVLMADVLGADEFKRWFSRFLPRLAQGEPATLFAPAQVSDRGDGKIAHLDGLNLSRAWCWRRLAERTAPDEPLRASALEAAERHLAASLPHVTGDYMGEHWLASFALLALR